MSEEIVSNNAHYLHAPEGLSREDFLAIPISEDRRPIDMQRREREMAFLQVVHRARLTSELTQEPNGHPVRIARPLLEKIVAEREDLAVPVYGMGTPGYNLLATLLANSAPAPQPITPED